MEIRTHNGDLSDPGRYEDSIAIDTETMGLNPNRDRLCVVQLSPGDGSADVIKIVQGTECPNLVALLSDPNRLKIFHYARFDLAVLRYNLGIWGAPVYCTKIASRLCRTYTHRHGLKELVSELLGKQISKQEQSSDWGAAALTDAQTKYAANDVIHLHKIKEKLDIMLAREGRTRLAKSCFDFLPSRAALDLLGWDEQDIFSHSTR